MLRAVVVQIDGEALLGNAVGEDEVAEEGEVNEAERVLCLEAAFVVEPDPRQTARLSPYYLLIVVDGDKTDSF